MKKTYWLIGVMLVAGITGWTQELVKNGGFEEYDTSQELFADFGLSRKQLAHRKHFFAQNESGKDGKCLKITGAKGHPYNKLPMALLQPIGGIGAGKTYVLSYDAKAQIVMEPGKEAAVEIRQCDAADKSPAYNKLTVNPDKSEWEHYELKFKAQKDVVSFELRIVCRNLDNSDIILIDNVSLKEAE